MKKKTTNISPSTKMIFIFAIALGLSIVVLVNSINTLPAIAPGNEYVSPPDQAGNLEAIPSGAEEIQNFPQR